MQHFPVFLSVVIVVRNQAELLEEVLSAAIDHLAHLVDDYELIVVDNASIDDSLSVYDKLTSDQNSGLPNLQVYSLIKEVVSDAATWVGLENSLGDFVAVIDPFTEDISLLPQLLERSVGGG
ncbi:MAG: glycosyltransferase family 2 protein [Neptuniibacter sp.]